MPPEHIKVYTAQKKKLTINVEEERSILPGSWPQRAEEASHTLLASPDVKWLAKLSIQWEETVAADFFKLDARVMSKQDFQHLLIEYLFILSFLDLLHYVCTTEKISTCL